MMSLFPNRISWDVPEAPHPGSYGAVRRHDRHTGVDIYVPEGTPVYALEDCRIISVSYFTGPNAKPPCPWWEETWAVTVINKSSTYLLYGELTPVVLEHDQRKAGDIIGYVKRVLKTDKGLPVSMLHVEMYSHLLDEHPYWHHDEPSPYGLLDPTSYLKQFK